MASAGATSGVAVRWPLVARTAVAAGDVARARQVLLAAADEAAASGQLSSEARLRHEVVRLDDPDLVRERLATLAARCEGELTGTYAAHASAAATGDADGLAGVADRFERLGLILYAAEAAYAAGRAYQRTWQPRHATRLYARAAALAARCEGARTPGLVAGAGTRPLTRREREVATLAARGGSSREIALQLHLSTRTVDNHLQNAFHKLGVTRRADLEKALTDQLP
jgi:DNA-binding CsgD family transcriptional regulator